MRAAAVLAILQAATPTLSAQEALLRMRPRQGQTTHYEMTMEMFMRGGPMAQMGADPELPFTKVTMWTTSTITAGGGEEFTERQVIDSAQAEFPAMPQMGQMVEQMGDMMRGMEMVGRMSSRGRVLEMNVTLSPAMQEVMAGMGQAAPGMGMGAHQLTSPSFWLLPEGPVRVGDSWRDSMRIALDSVGMEGAMTLAATYTLRGLEASVARIGFDGTYGWSGAQLPAELSFTVMGEVRLDLRAGRLLDTALDMNGSTPTEMGAIPMQMRMRMTSR